MAGITDAAARQGLYGGLVLAAVEVVALFIGNVVLPPTAGWWTDSTPVEVTAVALYAIAFVVIGARGRRRASTGWAGARAGAIAGFVVAVAFVGTFVVVDNAFYPTISHQPGKAGATRASLDAAVWSGGRAVLMLVLIMAVAAVLGQRGSSGVASRARTGVGPGR